MSGRLHFSVPPGLDGRALAQGLAADVRRKSKFKIPNSIQLQGVGNHEFSICYTSNAMRDAILAEAAATNIPRRLYDSITKRWYRVSEDPYIPSTR